MPHSDDFGDIEDESALLEAATQAELVSDDEYASSPRPAKRRKLTLHQLDGLDDRPRCYQGNRVAVAEGDEETSASDTPETSLSPHNQMNERQTKSIARGRGRNTEADRSASGSSEKKAQKPKHRVHIPARTTELADAFYTQPPPPSSSPWRIRGPIWQKQPPRTKNDTGIGHSAKRGDRHASCQREPSDDEDGFDPPPAPMRIGSGEYLLNVNSSARGDVSSFDAAQELADQELADLPSDTFASSSSSSSSSSSPPQKPSESVIYLSSQSSAIPGRQKNFKAPQTGLRQTTLFSRDGPAPPSQVNKRHNWPLANKVEPPTHHKLDPNAVKTWVYPTNLGTIRDYQFNIVARGLYHNTLVALPTGLGKTFIAAAIMLNWFRWTIDAQIVFVAPTKPLVAQQVEACFGIAGIPRSQTTMLTGEVNAGLRAEEWACKRVFFMTPQTLVNDLKTGIADPKKIVLIVVDEAHRATGGYAYVEIVKFIRRFNESFRVVALTATPGGKVEAVQKVIDGLDISHIEIRTEISLDIRQYVHQRNVEKIVFDNSEEMVMVMDLYSKAVQPVLNILVQHNAYWNRDPISLTPYGLTQARVQWQASEAGRRANMGVKGQVNSIINVLASLSHGMELLKYHGFGPFFHKMVEFRKDTERGSKSKYRQMINSSEHFEKMMTRVKSWVSDSDFIGHPKLEYLRSVILNHFLDAGEGRRADGVPPSSTRIMIFAQFRESVEEIVRVLKRSEPMVRPSVFVGQAGTRTSEAMNQKRQLETVYKFKTGVYNTLAATSIGEEGLDIGEVDLIVCYDSKSSPISMLQRIGRTGRKRAGNIIMLQMRGKEETAAAKAKDAYEKMQEKIADGGEFTFHDELSRRIIPRDVQPVVDKRVVEIPFENTQVDSSLPVPTKRKGRPPKRPPKKFHMPDGVRTGFVRASRLDDGDDEDERLIKRRKKTAALDTSTELETISIPCLQDVLLNDKQGKELERRYQSVFDGDELVSVPRLDRHPHSQRVAREVRFVPHGRHSKAFVAMMSNMHAMNKDRIEDMESNLPFADAELDDSLDIVVQLTSDADNAQPIPSSPRRKDPRSRFRTSDDAMEAVESSPPATDPRMRIRSQGIELGSDTSGAEEENEELDSELAGFVVDDAEPIAAATSSPVASSLPAIQPSKPFYVSQEANVTQEDEEGLPEISTLVQERPVNEVEFVEKEKPVAQNRQRRRRVIEDDEDSD